MILLRERPLQCKRVKAIAKRHCGCSMLCWQASRTNFLASPFFMRNLGNHTITVRHSIRTEGINCCFVLDGVVNSNMNAVQVNIFNSAPEKHRGIGRHPVHQRPTTSKCLEVLAFDEVDAQVNDILVLGCPSGLLKPLEHVKGLSAKRETLPTPPLRRPKTLNSK